MDQEFQFVKTNGITLRVATKGEGPLIIMVHGWPESWYSWRHQITAMADAGYKVAVPDVRGYGGSDKPYEISAYTLKEITADIAGLVDALDYRQAILFGHDWGGPIVWNTALLYPDKIRAVAGLSVPYSGYSPMPTLQLWRELYKDRFFYQLYFQKEGVAEAEFEADMRRALLITYYGGSGAGMAAAMATESPPKGPDATFLEGSVEPEHLPEWLTAEDLDYFSAEFEAGGMRGPLNRYRAQDLDWEQLKETEGKTMSQPSCFITGSLDPVNFFVPGTDLMERIKPFYDDLRVTRMIDGIGHWTQQEAPEEVNETLLEFLRGLQ